VSSNRTLNAEDVLPGMVLAHSSQSGPFWFDLVVANYVLDPKSCEGFGYPAVHKICVFSTASDGRIVLSYKILTAGTSVHILC